MKQDTTLALIKELACANEDRKAEALRYLKGDLPSCTDNKISIPLLVGMTEAARILGVSRTTLWRMVNAGIFQKIPINPSRSRIRRSDLEHFVAKGGLQHLNAQPLAQLPAQGIHPDCESRGSHARH